MIISFAACNDFNKPSFGDEGQNESAYTEDSRPDGSNNESETKAETFTEEKIDTSQQESS